MKKVFTFFLLVGFYGYSQNPFALKYYDAAVNYYNQQNYKAADSLFTRSNFLEPHKDTYYSRAACRFKMGDKEGHCSDLAYATQMKDKSAEKLFLKNCGKIDTIYLTKDGKDANKKNHRYKCIQYSYLDSLSILFATDSTGMPVRLKFKGNEGAELFTTVEEQAEFPGGIANMTKFIQMNLKYPVVARERGITGKCFLKYIINEDGFITDIFVVQGVPNCAECDEEAIRIVKLMPPWKPAKMKGKPVKCYFNMPISFRIKY